jgi:putative transposase
VEFLTEIREMTNKSWVLGSDQFKSKIQEQLSRPVVARPRGGDHKSERYRESCLINRSAPFKK